MNPALLQTDLRPLTRITRAIGGPKSIRAKLERTSFTLACYAHPERIQARLEKLRALGYLDVLPNRTQVIFGSIDMLRFFFIPARADHHEQHAAMSFRFQLLLRILEDPAVFLDPTGFFSHRDTLIGHVMRIVHCDPIYDLQVLAALPDGLAQLELQLEQMLDGSHPRYEAISAIVEDPGYHQRLLDHVREFRANPKACRRLLRDNVSSNPDFAGLAEIFGDLPSTMAYFASLPAEPRAAIRRLLVTRSLTSPRPEAQVERESAANEADLQPKPEAA